nr:odorant receptor 43 [Papilio glaucus]
MNDTEFSGTLKRCFELFEKCYIYFFVNGHSKFSKYWRLCCLVPFVIMHNVCILAFLSKVFTEEVNVFKVAYMISVYLLFLQAILMAVAVLSKKSDIENFINDLSLLWEASNLTCEQIKIKKNLTKRLNLYLGMFYWSNILGIWLHLLGPLTSVLFRRFVLGQYCELVLPFGSVYPYEPSDSWFRYLGTYTFQVYTMSCVVYAYVGSEFLMITLCANLAIEFSILREDLLHVSPHFKADNPCNQTGIELETNSGSLVTTSLQDFIRRHQILIGLANQLDEIFNKIIFINLLLVTATLCFFGFATTVARGALEAMNNLVAVLDLLLPTYIFCYYGELLKNESMGIAESAYTNQWYKGDVRYQKLIHFVIARAQRPCCLTSLTHVPVTMTMFTKVLSTTWSYFSLATSIYSRGEFNTQVGK